MLKSLATVTEVQEIIRTNSILVEVDGSIRRITLDKFIDAINSGETELPRSVAWGIPIKQAVLICGLSSNPNVADILSRTMAMLPSSLRHIQASMLMALLSMNPLAISCSMHQGSIIG